MSAAPEVLHALLEEARSAGFLGPGPIEAHLAHSAAFAQTAEAALGRPPETFVDLGTGGGVPGLVLAHRWTRARAVFVDSNQRRCSALREAVLRLDLEDRVEVVGERAELVAAPGPFRERFEVVTARGFAAPPVTAEIAAGLVCVGGIVVVSEPPDSAAGRWPAQPLAELGYQPAEPLEVARTHFVVVRKVAPTPDRFPRRVGRPAKRPLW